MAGKSGKKKVDGESPRWERRFEALQAEVDALRGLLGSPAARPTGIDVATAAAAAAALASTARIALVMAVREAEAISPAEAGRRTGIATGALYHHVALLISGGVLAKSVEGALSVTALGARLLAALGDPDVH
ncbi:MAG: hypothetical protein ACKO5K_00010 [Armatimonadota bacterium]